VIFEALYSCDMAAPSGGSHADGVRAAGLLWIGSQPHRADGLQTHTMGLRKTLPDQPEGPCLWGD